MTMLDHALELAQNGFRVHPCAWRGSIAKAPLTPHGHLDATRDPDTIRAWWERWPEAMIGGRVPEHFLVLDIDPRNGGSIEAIELAAGPLPQTLTSWSGRGDGGRHLWFLRPYGELTSTRLAAGIDLKTNGYLILPPSLHPATGKPYTWEVREPAPVPLRLRELLRPLRMLRTYKGAGKGGNGAPLVRLVAGLKDGERNRGLFWAASRAVEDGILDAITDNLIGAAVATGLSEREARRVIDSAARNTRVTR